MQFVFPKKEFNDTLFLDVLRGFAALYVMIGHARWLLWEGYSGGYLLHPQDYNQIDKFQMYFFSLFKYGHEAVLLFFVLSGFVIHLRYSRILANNQNANFDFFSFFKRRIIRIYPPMLFALLITFLLDSIGKYLGYVIYSGDTTNELINAVVFHDHSLLTLGGNLSFLMDMYVPVFGSDGPLWSLAYEWWFYSIYPFLYILSKRNVFLPLVISACLYFYAKFIGFEIILFDKVFSSLIIWYMGALLADIYTGRIKISFLFVFAASVGILFVSLFFKSLLASHFQILWALGFVAVFSFLFGFQKKIRLLKCLSTRLSFLGDFSYSLYLIHMPFLVLLAGYVIDLNRGAFYSGFFFVWLGIFISIITGYISYVIVEKPIIQFKRLNKNQQEITIES